MKAALLKTVLLIGVVVPAVALAVEMENSRASQAKLAVLVTSSEFLVNGEVRARTETDFTVLSASGQTTTILVSDDTSIMKGAETIKLSDLNVGDKVTVTVTRMADGRLVAAKVTVRGPYD